MTKTNRRTHTRDQTKRHGKHHKRGRDYVKVYAPYLPLIVSIIASIFLNFWHPSTGKTLAYATNMSVSGLLSATNAQRDAHGIAGLAGNGQLNSAAQAKANDMVARNYWSHTTPDGQQPWVFIDNTGYKYTKAGENLAYGFATSADAVTAWMNSPSHKANMLDSVFTEVGFGFANSANYNGDGNQTVVVAMYAKPQVAAASTPPPSSTAPAAPKPTTPTPSSLAPVAQQPAAPAPTETKEQEHPPVSTDNPLTVTSAQPQDIAKVEALTGGRAPWALTAVGMMLIGIAIFKLLHHSFKLRHLLNDTNKFILHHPLLDSTLLGLTILGLTLLQTVGTIL